jgi:hypothetical protein
MSQERTFTPILRKATSPTKMTPFISPISFLFLLLTLLLLSQTTSALYPDYSNSSICPNSSVYTPFKKWPQELALLPDSSSGYACWIWAECVIEKANEIRKQQFAATSLVMGLVPLILKEIAWPDRRIVYIPQTLNVWVEMLVRALGLLPVVKADAQMVKLKMVKWKKLTPGLLVMGVLIFAVLVSCAALVLMEVYSKRSSLGCPFPAFVLTWFVVALIPAAIGKPYFEFFFPWSTISKSFPELVVHP